MANSLFKHRKCGGELSLNLAPLFTLRSPSIVLTSEGMSPGVMELRERDGGEAMFICSKCNSDVKPTSDDVLVECSVCIKHYAASTMLYSEQMPGVCPDCLAMLTGEKTPTAKALEIADYVILPKESIKFVSFSDVLKKPVRATNN